MFIRVDTKRVSDHLSEHYLIPQSPKPAWRILLRTPSVSLKPLQGQRGSTSNCAASMGTMGSARTVTISSSRSDDAARGGDFELKLAGRLDPLCRWQEENGPCRLLCFNSLP
jgi:hypothetical protein